MRYDYLIQMISSLFLVMVKAFVKRQEEEKEVIR